MSIAIMTAVWAQAPVSGSELLMLLALADNANDEGLAHPSYRYLARKTRLSERQTKRIIKKLVDEQVIEVAEVGGNVAGRRLANTYRIEPGWRGDILSPVTPTTPQQGDAEGSSGVSQMSLQSPEEPSSISQGVAKAEWETADAVQSVFDTWVEATNPSLKTLTPPRERDIKKLLTATQDVDYAIQAIKGFAATSKSDNKSIGNLISTGPNTGSLASRIDHFASKAPLGSSFSPSERPWSQVRIPDGVPEFTRDSLKTLLGELEEAERVGDDTAMQYHLGNVPPGYQPVKADNGRWKVVRA